MKVLINHHSRVGGWIILSPDLINSHSQVSNTGSKGPLVFSLILFLGCVCVGGGGGGGGVATITKNLALYTKSDPLI